MTSAVITLTKHECSAAGDVGFRVFADDPVWAAVFPDADRRHRILASGFRGGLVHGVLSGKVVEATPTLSAVSMWAPPEYHDSVMSWMRALPALAGFVANLTLADARRFLRWTKGWETRRRQLLPQPHWYLEMICAAPRWQGFGLGAVLALHGLKRAAADGRPVYLETENPRNVRFYTKLGFEIVEAGDDHVLHVQIWRMVCQPDHAVLPRHGTRSTSGGHPWT
jgi:ribosomal protein S18 acetylase RimI-like enzyme